MSRSGLMAFGLTLLVTASWFAAPAAPPAASSGTRSAAPAAGDEDRKSTPALRLPVAAAWRGDGSRLVVANSRSGSLSLVNVRTGNVLAEHAIARELAGLVRLNAGDEYLTLDVDRGRLLHIRFRDEKPTVLQETETMPNPTSLALGADGATVAVSGKWSRGVEFLRIARETAAGEPSIHPVAKVPVAFGVRELLWLPDGEHLLAADAFAGLLAVINVPAQRVVAERTLTVHNIRGLALTGDGQSLLMTHQVLDGNVPINWQTVHSGTLMNNVASKVPVRRLLEGNVDLDPDAETIPIGANGHGGGDPTGIAVDAEGGIVVVLGGTSELVHINRFGVLTERVEVGERPIQCLIAPAAADDERLVITINTFGDSLTVVDLNQGRAVRQITLGPQRKRTAAERGEALFHNSRLSHDGWLSCQSCHTDGHTNGLMADTFGDGSWGAPKRVLPLGGVAFTDRWAWNGEVQELFDQVRKSMLTTMLSDGVENEHVNDLVAYLETLLPPPPLNPVREEAADREQAARGRSVFLNQGCQQCHVPPLTYTSSDAFDVGLEDENGRRKFNPPSLRGVGHHRAFFHDGRAATLESLFQKFEHPGGTRLTEPELRDLTRFLRSL